MGLTIFYSGKIRDMRLLPALTKEVKDICDDLNWTSGYLKPYPEIPLTGFQFHPPGSEPIWLTFHEDGRLADPVYYVFKDETFSPPKSEDEFWLSSVSQYAGMDAHIALIKLLKYLSRKYFEDFDLIDESEYWETGDAILCQDRFEYFSEWMNQYARKLDKLDGRTGETGETFSERIEALLLTKGWDAILDAL